MRTGIRTSMLMLSLMMALGAAAQPPQSEAEDRERQEKARKAEMQRDAEALENRLKQEMNELRQYLGEMMDRQSDLTEMVKSLAESGQAVAGDKAKRLLEDAEEGFKEQREELNQHIETLREEMRAKAEEMREQAEEERRRAEAEKDEQTASRIIKLEHASPDQVLRVLQPLYNVEFSSDAAADVIGVRGRPEDVEAFAEAAEQLDVPSEPVKNIELRIYLVGATKAEDAIDTHISDQVADVVGELQGTYPYRDWGLLETTYVRCREGEEAGLSGTFTGEQALDTGEEAKRPFDFEFRAKGVSLAPEDSVAVNGWIMTIMDPRGVKGVIASDVTLDLGRPEVIGKASMAGTVDAVFLIIRAEVL